MPTKQRMLEGALSLREDLTDDCFETPQLFAELLTQKVGIKFPVDGEDGFVIYGFQTPGEDHKGQLWVRTDKAGHFAGLFLFIEGKWQRIYDYSNTDVIWRTGDSRKIEPGFALIDGTLPNISEDVQLHIITFYHVDPDATVNPAFPVYSYFATVYQGI